MAGFDENEIGFTGDDEEINLLELEKASEDAPVGSMVNMIMVAADTPGARPPQGGTAPGGTSGFPGSRTDPYRAGITITTCGWLADITVLPKRTSVLFYITGFYPAMLAHLGLHDILRASTVFL
jgi:hypothetical protein